MSNTHLWTIVGCNLQNEFNLFSSLPVILLPGSGFTTKITPHGLTVDLIWLHSGNSGRWITLTDPVILHPQVTAGLEGLF